MTRPPARRDIEETVTRHVRIEKLFPIRDHSATLWILSSNARSPCLIKYPWGKQKEQLSAQIAVESYSRGLIFIGIAAGATARYGTHNFPWTLPHLHQP
jgi:hypothetical protein